MTVMLSGCVKRMIVVESDPPGATVWINEHLIGKAPVNHEFITHGRYLFRLRKPGFRERVTREMVRAPWFQWIPIDFVTENLLPIRFKDIHRFRFTLTPQPPEEKLQVEQKEDLEKVLTDLKDPDPDRRRAACAALARWRDPATASAVEGALADPNAGVRAAALGAWRAIRGEQSLEVLLKALREDPAREVRWQAAAELEALHSPEAVPGLIEALRDKDTLARSGAAEALKGIPDPRSVQSLIRALKDPEPVVRRAAAEGLGRIGDRAAVPALCRALFHHDVWTRRKAVESLARLKDPASGPALVATFTDWDPKVRRTAAEALVAFGDARVVPTLIRRLRALKPWTREQAAFVLGGLKDPRAVEPLQRALRREPDPPARSAMEQALQSLGAPA